MSLQTPGLIQPSQVSTLFKQENDKGTGFFSGGRTSVQLGTLTDDEIVAILRSYRSNLTLIQRISSVLYNDLISQQTPDYDPAWQTNGRSVVLKFAQIAKGTLASQGGTKPISWPPQVGQIGVAWLDPYLLQYSRAHNSTYPAYTDYTPNTWNVQFNAALGSTLVQLLGSSTYAKGTPPATVPTLTSTNYYQSNATTNQRQISFLFQNGILELGTTPDIEQWIIQTNQTQAYSAYTSHPLIYQPVDSEKLIYQYNTPGVIPLYNDMGIYLAGLAQSSVGVHTMPLLGMSFYETNLLSVPSWI